MSEGLVIKKKRRKKNPSVVYSQCRKKRRVEPIVTLSSECCFCHEGENSVSGTLFCNKEANIAAHQFCLFFSAGLPQHGQDEEGFDGFLLKDIIKEAQRANRILCKFCQRPGASSGCCLKTCRLSYHFSCGYQQGLQFVFQDCFDTYCKSHRSYQDLSSLNTRRSFDSTILCPLCLEQVNFDPDAVLKTPCCKNIFIHRSCVQTQANVSGYFFRCPTCNNEKEFQQEMSKFGVYIPQRDAAWEENNAFSDLLEQYNKCDSSTCLCPKGISHSTETGKWCLLRCYHCGQSAVHRHCLGNNISIDFDFVCRDCNDVVGAVKATTVVSPERFDERYRQHKRLLAALKDKADPVLFSSYVFAPQLWRKKFDISECRILLDPLPTALVNKLKTRNKISVEKLQRKYGVKVGGLIILYKNTPKRKHRKWSIPKKSALYKSTSKAKMLDECFLYPSIASMPLNAESKEENLLETLPVTSSLSSMKQSVAILPEATSKTSFLHNFDQSVKSTVTEQQSSGHVEEASFTAKQGDMLHREDSFYTAPETDESVTKTNILSRTAERILSCLTKSPLRQQRKRTISDSSEEFPFKRLKSSGAVSPFDNQDIVSDDTTRSQDISEGDIRNKLLVRFPFGGRRKNAKTTGIEENGIIEKKEDIFCDEESIFLYSHSGDNEYQNEAEMLKKNVTTEKMTITSDTRPCDSNSLNINTITSKLKWREQDTRLEKRNNYKIHQFKNTNRNRNSINKNQTIHDWFRKSAQRLSEHRPIPNFTPIPIDSDESDKSEKPRRVIDRGLSITPKKNGPKSPSKVDHSSTIKTGKQTPSPRLISVSSVLRENETYTNDFNRDLPVPELHEDACATSPTSLPGIHTFMTTCSPEF